MEANEEGKGRKAKRRRAPIACAVVVVVLVIAGGGFYAWHNQPSFCNAICHEPMDFYVEGYYGEGAADSAQLAVAHQQEDVTCLQCHEATLDAQINEGMTWVSGAYEMNADGSLVPHLITADKNQCATVGCHDWNDVVAATENWGGQKGGNPHSSHQGEAIDCSNCHSVHGQSNMYCNTCHDWEVPEGWTSPEK